MWGALGEATGEVGELYVGGGHLLPHLVRSLPTLPSPKNKKNFDPPIKLGGG